MPAGGEALDGAIVTFTSPATLFGAKVSVAAASGVVIVPPSVAEINVGGGESPLAVFAFGSGIVVGAGVGAAVELSGATVSVLLVPTRTLTAPVPGTVVVAGAEETAFGSGCAVTAAVGVSEVLGSTLGATASEFGIVTATVASLVTGLAGAGGSLVVIGGTVSSATAGSIGAAWLEVVTEVSVGACGALELVGAELIVEESVVAILAGAAACTATGGEGAAVAGAAVATGAGVAGAGVAGAEVAGAGGIGSGRLSGTAIAGTATPVESS